MRQPRRWFLYGSTLVIIVLTTLCVFLWLAASRGVEPAIEQDTPVWTEDEAKANLRDAIRLMLQPVPLDDLPTKRVVKARVRV